MDIEQGAFRDIKVRDLTLRYGAESLPRVKGAVFEGLTAKTLAIQSYPQLAGTYPLSAITLAIGRNEYSGAQRLSLCFSILSCRERTLHVLKMLKSERYLCKGRRSFRSEKSRARNNIPEDPILVLTR